MLALVGFLSVLGGTCLACSARKTAFESQLETASGLLVIGGLGMIGALLPVLHIA